MTQFKTEAEAELALFGPPAEPVRVEIIRSVKDVDARFAAGSEAARMMHAALNPNPETWEQRIARMEREAFEKATKIDAKDYTGWVSWPGHGDDGYFESVEALIEHCASHELNSPRYVWACIPQPFKLDADEILDNALEEHFDGARGEISKSEEKRLQAFLDEWAAAQKIVSWREDRTRAVMLSPADEDATADTPSRATAPEIYVAVPNAERDE